MPGPRSFFARTSFVTGVAVVAIATAASVIPPARALAAEDAPQAAPIPAEAKVKAADVKGLVVEFYDFYPKDAAGIDSLEIAKNWINGHKPALTYSLNLPAVDFAPGKEMSVNAYNTKLGTFLLGEAELKRRSEAEKDFPKRLTAPIGPRTIMVFSGFIEVKKAGAYTLSIPCDDGDETSIGGVVVHARPHFGGMNIDPDSAENKGAAEFAEAGIYPIKVTLWDRDPGGIGIHVFSDDLNPKGKRHANGHVLLPILPAPKAAAPEKTAPPTKTTPGKPAATPKK